ncbi:MAG TPA: cell wall-binding repeat-containing protein [Nitriliruptorales bacterium]|nr:cell wall-binding repeat-containing protein [Nitriliruptorales bacterium]
MLLMTALGTPAGPAAGAACPSPGGADRSFDLDPSAVADGADLAVVGGGWGHGVGMSQYGAQGAALQGCAYTTILDVYYPGTRLDTVPTPEVARVGLLDPRSQSNGGATVRLTPEDGPVAWRLHGCGEPPGGVCASQPPAQQRGAVWSVRAVRDGGYVISDARGAPLWRGGDRYALLEAVHDGVVVSIQVPGLTRRSRWGFTRLDSVADGDGKLFVVEHVTAGNGHSGLERYLWGLAEVPSSWHVEALRAQAVAGRAYALNRVGLASRDRDCRCDLYATTADQHWTGWQREADDQQASGGRWKAAVTATAGQVPRHVDAGSGAVEVAETFYSSSHGGLSDSARDVWGSDIAYLRAVDTSNWERAADNPRQRWTVGYSRPALANRFGLASLTSLTVERRGAGGRPTVRDLDGNGAPDGAKVVGADASGSTVTLWLSGEQLRSKLGSYSALVHVYEVSSVPVTRLEETDPAHRHRIGTSVAISRHGWTAAPSVVVARADEPADALAGAALAGRLQAPLLITWPDALHDLVAAEVRRLGADAAYLLGGERALAPAVADGLRQTGVDRVERVAGPTRVETAAAIADRLEPGAGASAYLVFSEAGNPRSWPDALAVSGPAARLARAGTPRPVLVTGGTVPPPTWDALARLRVTELVLAGGTATIPEAVPRELEARGYATRRLAGPDRYATSRAVADDRPAPPGRLLVATGQNFPDGLSAGALAGQLDVTFVLVPTDRLDEGGRAWVEALDWEQPRLLVAGGPAAVASDTVAALQHALEPPSS